jgi:hypothetical protein
MMARSRGGPTSPCKPTIINVSTAREGLTLKKYMPKGVSNMIGRKLNKKYRAMRGPFLM